MMIKMWLHKTVFGYVYAVQWDRAYYQWSPISKRWYRMISQASGWASLKRAEEENRVMWVKLLNKKGIPGLDSTNC